MTAPRGSAALVCLAAFMLAGAGAAQAQSPLFEVEKSDATKLLQVTDDAGLLVRGAHGAGTIPATGPGVRLMWYPRFAALRAGEVTGSHWDDSEIGSGSVALGRDTRASGTTALALNHDTHASGNQAIAGGYKSVASGSVSLALGAGVVASGQAAAALGQETVASASSAAALGYRTTASGFAAAALGSNTVASGEVSFAAGFRSKAIGRAAVALGEDTQASSTALAAGYRTQANGNASMAVGTGTVAAGVASVALGTGVTAQGNGSFAFGDRNIGFQHTPGPNEFWVRAFGGIGLNTGVGIGCDLPPNTGAWACTSSKLVKEAFEEVDGEEILARLKEVPIQRWRYIGTEARHVGPFAEDFHAAFGLGDDATKIAQIDADGVALSAVQALERRTAELQAENAALRTETAELRAEHAAQRTETSELRRRLEALEGSNHGP